MSKPMPFAGTRSVYTRLSGALGYLEPSALQKFHKTNPGAKR